MQHADLYKRFIDVHDRAMGVLSHTHVPEGVPVSAYGAGERILHVRRGGVIYTLSLDGRDLNVHRPAHEPFGNLSAAVLVVGLLFS